MISDKEAMEMVQERILELRSGYETACIDAAVASNLAYKPQFISNNYKQGKKVLSSIIFNISINVNPSGIVIPRISGSLEIILDT